MRATKTYEIAFWLKADAAVGSPTLGRGKDSEEKPAEESLDFLTQTIGGLGGEVLKTVRPVKKKLAYPLKRETESYFGTVLAKLSPEAAKNMPQNLKHHGEILRLAIFEAKKEKAPRAIPRIFSRRTKFSVAREEKKSETALEELDKKLEEILGA